MSVACDVQISVVAAGVLIPTLPSRWTYRTAPAPPSRKVTLKAEVVSSIMWWWILYHFMTDYEHITVSGRLCVLLFSVCVKTGHLASEKNCF